MRDDTFMVVRARKLHVAEELLEEVDRCAAPMIPLCHCGGCGVLREGHYPNWREIACDRCDRVEFGRDERAVILRWTTAHP